MEVEREDGRGRKGEEGEGMRGEERERGKERGRERGRQEEIGGESRHISHTVQLL